MKKLILALLFVMSGIAYAVEVVENPAKPETPMGLKLEKTGQFPLDAPEADIWLTLPGYFRISRPDRIVLQDRMQGIVHLYSLDGEHLAMIGEKGQGPGQLKFGLRQCFLIDKHGNILLIDEYKKMILRFDREGRFLGSRSVTQNGSYRWAEFRRLSTGGMVLSGTVYRKEKRMHEPLVVITDDNLNFKQIIYTADLAGLNRHDRHDRQEIPVAITDSDNILLSIPSKEHIEIQEFNTRGQLIRKIQRDYSPLQRTSRRLAYMKKTEEIVTSSFNLPDEEGWGNPSPLRNSSGRIWVDGGNRIWLIVSCGDPKGSTLIEYNVFSPQGRLIDVLPNIVGHEEFNGNQVYYITVGDDMFMMETYAIIESQGGNE